MDAGNKEWWMRPWLLVELFAMANLGFLSLDIWLAHSVNQFRREAEYIPFFFSLASPVILGMGLAMHRRWVAAWRDLGYLVGYASVFIGLAGVILHLDSAFFLDRTLRSLTYSAPFAAPLAYTGIGFLLICNRMVDVETEEWAKWVLLMTLGGFAGNFVLSLTDHAGNGFFEWEEWIPVVSSALAIGFLVTPLLTRVSRSFLKMCAGLLICEAGVGVWGFALHVAGNLRGPSVHLFQNFVNGAPPFAPLLFPNLVLPGMIALWRLGELQQAAREGMNPVAR